LVKLDVDLAWWTFTWTWLGGRCPICDAREAMCVCGAMVLMRRGARVLPEDLLSMRCTRAFRPMFRAQGAA